MECIICKEPLTGKQTKYCSRLCKGKDGNHQYQSYLKQKERANKRKTKLVKSLGGCCNVCGYKANLMALCFHHLDPSKKEQKLDARSLANGNFNKSILEAEGCQLLCHNCHMEIHHPDGFNWS